MSQESPQHPQVTPEQIQLWETNPVTKAFLQCLEWYELDVKDAASDGSLVDSTSADLTNSMVHINLGQQQGLRSAIAYAPLFDRYGMVMDEGDES